ncbi:FAD-dependent monooxygenase [Actinophytocola oryzae]|uniref:Anthraniloyl-CoA monooxygenase n=1 Tax=Actinophytocola oryzae TaxID=502181 RepID=A0A4R7UQZ5_9PSEU|nr:FAD-dependent monooxygenase [Actinophytocola oryzae]TDV36670.1 anthraniloyl-CoA monooxygenase [Actinophytocola oryzae]
MRVSIVGAGPSGLYLAILLRKAGHDVSVVERNAPDATFGWGVVFSEETLGALRDADYPTYLEITDSFARWTSIDIHYRDRVLRSSGHTFSAIRRTHLLDILQRRARSLGASLTFHQEASDVDGDLVVAADGANSGLRKRFTAEFGSSSSPQGCKYVWFGTDLVLDAFTFVFRETEHGLFQVHAYPFDEHTSTWIVETTEATWRRAGLDTMSEEDSMAFCQSLFAAELGDHRLRSNKSIWLDFPLVRNQHWHHGNVVLIGDAAHTAHFSIGSGTKLAMEDAIALANALERYPSTLESALVDYELERQPVVERFQQAAGDSAAYFGRVANYLGLAPIQFAANLLTRSGRISHANLMQRDPKLVRVLDAWFASSATGTPLVAGAVAAPPMFAPLRVGGVTLRNRVVRAVPEVVEAGRAGAGLVLTGFVAIAEDGRTTPACPVLDDSWAPVVKEVHDTGALVGVRLGHAGRRGATRPTGGVDVPLRDGWPLVSASPLPYTPYSAVPAALSEAGMARVRDDFVAAVGRAREAGFDALELELADGYLLASFLSPLTNRRDDVYGTEPLRFPLSVVDAVRAEWPGLLMARVTVTDWARGGLTVEQGVANARALAEHGVDLVHVRAGHTTATSRPEYRRGYLTTLSDRVRNEAGVATLVGGYLTTPDEVNTVVAAGRADLCLFEPPPTPLEEVGA